MDICGCYLHNAYETNLKCKVSGSVSVHVVFETLYFTGQHFRQRLRGILLILSNLIDYLTGSDLESVITGHLVLTCAMIVG